MNLGREGLRDGGRDDDKTRTGKVHELLELIRVETAEKSVGPAPEIPDHAGLGVIDVREIHFREKIAARHLIKLRGRKGGRDQREGDERGGERRDDGADCGAFREALRSHYEQVAREQEREDRKSVVEGK